MNDQARARVSQGQETSATARSPRVLLAEDDEYMRHLLANALRRDGFEVVEASSGAELVTKLEEFAQQMSGGLAIDLIITDIRMPWVSGLTVLASLQGCDWAPPIILITAFGDEETHMEARRLGAVAVFDKPFDLHDLRKSARHFAGVY